MGVVRGGLVLGTWIVRLLPGESQRQTAGRADGL